MCFNAKMVRKIRLFDQNTLLVAHKHTCLPVLKLLSSANLALKKESSCDAKIRVCFSRVRGVLPNRRVFQRGQVQKAPVFLRGYFTCSPQFYGRRNFLSHLRTLYKANSSGSRRKLSQTLRATDKITRTLPSIGDRDR